MTVPPRAEAWPGARPSQAKARSAEQPEVRPPFERALPPAATRPPTWLERHEVAVVACLLVIGVVLRAVPILWGSTYIDSRQATFHPDEPKLVRPLDDFPESLATFDDYRYPTLLPFVYGALWVPVGEAIGVRDHGPSQPGAPSYEAAQVFGRGLNVLIFGLGGMLLVWSFARRHFGVGPAVLALAALNAMGRPVSSVALVLPDIAAAVLFFAVFDALARAFDRETLTRRAMIPVGAFLGAGAAAKYTPGLAAPGVVMVLAEAWRRGRLDGRGFARLLGTAALVSVATFLLFVPGAVFETGQFVQGLRYELHSKLQTASNSLEYLPRAFTRSFPPWMLAAAILGAILTAVRPSSGSRRVVLGAAGVCLALYFSTSLRSFRADYAIFFFPFVAVFAGLGLWSVLRLSRLPVAAIVVALLLVTGTASSASWVVRRYTAEVRYRADHWIEENLPPGPLGIAPVPSHRDSGLRAPQGYHYVGVHQFPEHILVFQRPAERVLSALEDPEGARALMARAFGEQRARELFSWEPQARRFGMLQDADLQFYEDVLLGEERRWRYELLVEFLPPESPLDMPGRWVRIYRRVDSSGVIEASFGRER